MPYKAKQHYQDEYVADGYDAARFRGFRGRLVHWLEQRLLLKALAGLPPGSRVLDLPVGTGRMARLLSNAGYRVAGADISRPMLGLARELAGLEGVRHDLVRGDGERLPFADQSFDAVVCLRLLPHLPAGARCALLREMARVSRGRVVAAYQPHRVALWWLVNGLLLRKRLPRHYASPAELDEEFAACGLRPVRSHSLLRWAFMDRTYVLAPSADAGSSAASGQSIPTMKAAS